MIRRIQGIRAIGMCGGLWFASAGTVPAQTPADHTGRPPVEFGLEASKLAPRLYGDFQTDDLEQPFGGVRLTVPVSPRFAVEGIVTAGHRGDTHYSRIEGLYLIQVKQRVRSLERGGFRPFLTYGGAGYYARVRYPGHTIPQPDGRDIVIEPGSYGELDPPIATVVGAGVDLRVSGHLALRADVQSVSLLYLPLALRFSAGMSIPFSGYSRN